MIKELVKKANSLICDINTTEITKHIAKEDLSDWIRSWKLNFRLLLNKFENLDDENCGWIRVQSVISEPEENEQVQLMVCDESGDYLTIYTCVGLRVDKFYVSSDEIVRGIVIAYKPLSEPLKLSVVKELGWI